MSSYSHIIKIGLYGLTPIQKKVLEKNAGDTNLKELIDKFNTFKHCDCCKRHYYSKPRDITDPIAYSEDDSRYYTGPVGVYMMIMMTLLIFLQNRLLKHFDMITVHSVSVHVDII